MRIGIDFDNTIACYDGVFHAAALERGVIPSNLARDKNSVRDYLNSAGRADVFTELQGHVYGARMDLASPFPGVADFVTSARKAGHDLFIVSHKTRVPILGAKHDLHGAARGFLTARGLVGEGRIDPSHVLFELTKEAKVDRIGSLRCDAFIDDLPEIFALAAFPRATRPILFDPADQFSDVKFDRRASWAEISAEFCHEHV
jgi:hypothetical protein